VNVLVACEFSGTVREAFRRRGHNAWSCDILPAEDGGPHIQDDVLAVLDETDRTWDLMIAHPPCTYLTLAGLHWNNRIAGRGEKTELALEFVRRLLDTKVPMICLENPIGAISKHIRKPDQIIQPWQFGHPESKQTAFWLQGLPKLTPTDILTPTRFQENGCPRWENQTATGQNKLGPSPDRWKIRSRTYSGIAEAMADQWGKEMEGR
jgi:site-specific DNA-cytosine methylase